MTKLTAIYEVIARLPPQVVVYAKYTTVPKSVKSLESIVSEVGSVNVSQGKELADV